MTDETVFKKIVQALDDALAKIETPDYPDTLNALTAVMIDIVKRAEYLSTPEAYERAADVFASAAVTAKAAEAKAAAVAGQRLAARHISTQAKAERFKKRQQRVAARAAKAARQKQT